MDFKKIEIEELQFNPFTKIGNGWFLITAGDSVENCNTMTASWGSLGVMWRKNIASVFVGPSRYTKEFLEREDYFTMSFFDETYRDSLNYLGNVSGRSEADKIKNAKLTPQPIDNAIAFKEANMIFVVKKVYHGQFEKNAFVGTELLEEFYQENELHEVFSAEITAVYVRG